MASETALGIPEDLVAILSKLELEKLGEPVWKLQKRKTGYSVNIFWKNSEHSGGTPINAHPSRCQNRRRQRSRLRLEAFIEKKKIVMTGLGNPSDPIDRAKNTGNPACSSGVKPRCEKTPPSPGASSKQDELSLCLQPKVAPSMSSQKMDPDVSTIAPIVEKTITDLPIEEPGINLANCSSVVYEERNSIPGVKVVNEDREEWTPVVKRKGERRQFSKGDGTRCNPVVSDKELRLAFAKDIAYQEVDGTPGLRFRKGRSNHSFEWTPIVPDSPIASRTRIKLKS